MKMINYVIAAAGAMMVAATWLPFDFSGSMWHPGTLPSRGDTTLFVIAALAVIALAMIALRAPRFARVAGGAIAVASLAITLGVMSRFVPLFDANAGTLSSLFHDGGAGAHALWLAAVIAGLGGVALAIAPVRTAPRVGLL